MTACIKSGILGGIVLFIWGVVSWVGLPWHAATMNHFSDEKAIATVITTNATQSGIYVLPLQQARSNQSVTQMPFVFTSVRLEGMPSMILGMVMSLVSQMIAAFFVAWLLSKTLGLNYLSRVIFVVTFALAASLVSHGSYWIWFGFNTHFTLVAMADLLVGWFFAGLVLAKCYQARLV